MGRRQCLGLRLLSPYAIFGDTDGHGTAVDDANHLLQSFEVSRRQLDEVGQFIAVRVLV